MQQHAASVLGSIELAAVSREAEVQLQAVVEEHKVAAAADAAAETKAVRKSLAEAAHMCQSLQDSLTAAAEVHASEQTKVQQEHANALGATEQVRRDRQAQLQAVVEEQATQLRVADEQLQAATERRRLAQVEANALQDSMSQLEAEQERVIEQQSTAMAAPEPEPEPEPQPALEPFSSQSKEPQEAKDVVLAEQAAAMAELRNAQKEFEKNIQAAEAAVVEAQSERDLTREVEQQLRVELEEAIARELAHVEAVGTELGLARAGQLEAEQKLDAAQVEHTAAIVKFAQEAAEQKEAQLTAAKDAAVASLTFEMEASHALVREALVAASQLAEAKASHSEQVEVMEKQHSELSESLSKLQEQHTQSEQARSELDAKESASAARLHSKQAELDPFQGDTAAAAHGEAPTAAKTPASLESDTSRVTLGGDRTAETNELRETHEAVVLSAESHVEVVAPALAPVAEMEQLEAVSAERPPLLRKVAELRSENESLQARLPQSADKQETLAGADAGAEAYVAETQLRTLARVAESRETRLTAQEDEHSQALQDDTVDMGTKTEADLVKQLDDEKAAHAKLVVEVGTITSAVPELEARATRAEAEAEALTTQLAESSALVAESRETKLKAQEEQHSQALQDKMDMGT